MVLASPFFKKDAKILEDIQRRATKMVSGLHELPYPTRFCKLKLQLWFIEEDGVMPFWFINLLIQRQFLVFLPLASQDSRTRGHKLKFSRHFSSKGQCAHFLTNRVANLWNKLLRDTVAAQTTDSFKNHLDNEWSKKRMEV